MIHLTVTVSNTDELLNAEAYDAGALLRWESAATVDGSYVEGGTEALVSGTSLYEVWDIAGSAGTFYKTRISDAAGTTFSPYSEPFQSAGVLPSLSVDQFRAFVNTPLSDEALLILLDSAAQAIVAYAGPWGEINELIHTRGPLLMLGRPALSITSIVERWPFDSSLTLDPDDYEIRSSRQTLVRLRTGPNPSWTWRGRVDVTYTPFDDFAERQRVQRALVMLELANQPGLVSQTIGTWSETFGNGSTKPYSEQRQDILASLGSGLGIR